MEAVLVLVFMVGLMAFMLRSLAPSRSKSLRVGGRARDLALTHTPGSSERRGAFIAALASATVSDFVVVAGDLSGQIPLLVVLGIVAALSYRRCPDLAHPILGIAGAFAALALAFEATCTDPGAIRGRAGVLVALGGLAVFLVARSMRAALRRYDLHVPLAAFGVISLGLFVAGPFGLPLIDLVGLGATYAGVFVLYGLVCGLAAFRPAFANSFIGVGLLSAHLAVDTVIGDACTLRRGTVLWVTLGFVIVWWLAGRIQRGR